MGASLNLSLLYTNEKNYPKAVEMANQVLDKQPENVKALYRRANVGLLSGDLDTAKADVLAANGLDPKNKAVRSLYKKV